MRLLVLLMSFPFLGFSQLTDSLNAVKQIDSLIKVSRDFTAKWKLEQALEAGRQAESITMEKLGKVSAAYGSCSYNYGRIYVRLGNFTEAEKWYIEAKTIQEMVTGKEHADYAHTLTNLAAVYKDQGKLEKAEPLHLEAKLIREKVLGKNHPDYAGSLINLSLIYIQLGNLEKAELMLLEAKDIFEVHLKNRSHPFYWTGLGGLASVYFYTQKYEKAEQLYIEIKAFRELKYGRESAEYAAVINSLAGLSYTMKDYVKAEQLFLEAKEIWGKVYGTENVFYSGCLGNLAAVNSKLGRRVVAEQYFLEALNLREKILGKKHRDYALNLENLALFYWETLDYKKSEICFIELSSLNHFYIKSAAHHLSEKEMVNYLEQFFENQSQIYSLTQLSESEDMAFVSYDNALFYKGFLLQALLKIKREALLDQKTNEKYKLLKSCESRLASQYSIPKAEQDSALIIDLETQSNYLEKELALNIMGWEGANREIHCQEVQSSLKDHEAAVEFVHYRYFDIRLTDRIMYVALVLKPGFPRPKFVFLFEENSLDSILINSGDRRADYVNSLYTIADRGAQALTKDSKSLFELIWKPLANELEGVKTIYYSSSGLLHRLNLGAVPIDDEQTLLDRFFLVELGSTRQLVIPNVVETKNNDALLFGGIKYEMDSNSIAVTNRDLNLDALASRGEIQFNYSDSGLRGGSWNYLKWTEREIMNLETHLASKGLRVDVRKGYRATEEAFKTIGQSKPSPRILHMATHGFFFPDPIAKISENNDLIEQAPAFKSSGHPMIRSGLILAGGNYAWQSGKPLQPNMEDGILTAYEISQMNLSNTELVVLSACETGLGDIQGNEGVYGLQRAFKIAGAKYLIMSLWQIPDQETSVFMATFYKNWIDLNMSIRQAFRATQKQMRDRFINPYQWAGFVLVE